MTFCYKNLRISAKKCNFAGENLTNRQNIAIMKRHFLPDFIGISMTKSQFCFATGCSPYKLKCTIAKHPEKYRRLGLGTYDKLLMPAVVRELCADTGLRVDIDYFTQYVAGQRGVTPIYETE